MGRIYMFLVPLILLSVTSQAQRLRLPHPPHRHGSHIRRIKVHPSAYRLSDRTFVKWTPSALAPISAASIRFGFEYCFAKRYGVALDAGYVLGTTIL